MVSYRILLGVAGYIYAMHLLNKYCQKTNIKKTQVYKDKNNYMISIPHDDIFRLNNYFLVPCNIYNIACIYLHNISNNNIYRFEYSIFYRGGKIINSYANKYLFVIKQINDMVSIYQYDNIFFTYFDYVDRIYIFSFYYKKIMNKKYAFDVGRIIYTTNKVNIKEINSMRNVKINLFIINPSFSHS